MRQSNPFVACDEDDLLLAVVVMIVRLEVPSDWIFRNKKSKGIETVTEPLSAAEGTKDSILRCVLNNRSDFNSPEAWQPVRLNLYVR
jgi:hypothetical protein